MSQRNNNQVTSGITLLGLLQVAFIVLKVCNIIHWSWWFVLLPIEIEIATCIIGGIVLYVTLRRHR